MFLDPSPRPSVRRFLGLHLALLALAVLAGCEDAPCDPGTDGCPCLESGQCRLPGLDCVHGMCVEHPGAPPPSSACYTPCSADFTDRDGNARTCSHEGLTEGCLADAVCVEGTCVPTDPAYVAAGLGGIGRCEDDADCPDHQACLDGRCFSNCEADVDCGDGRRCLRHVCRDACATSSDCPTAGQVCREGSCYVPAGNEEGAHQTLVQAGLSIDRSELRFTSSSTTASFVIRNGTQTTQVVEVVKAEDRYVDADGVSQVHRADRGDSPLGWLEMGTTALNRIDRFTVVVPPSGTATVQLASARNPDLFRWHGRIEVGNDLMGREVVALSYSEEVAGRWSGRIHYFGNFADGARPEASDFPLDEFVADRTDVATVDRIPNAFLQAWARFRNNAFSLPEMDALLATTIDGSWQSTRVRQLCAAAGYGSSAACAPYGGTGSASVLLYTSSTLDNPIPSGVVPMDFSMNLRPASTAEIGADPRCGGDPNCFVGRIETSLALQYGANPALHLVFGGDPTGCASDGPAGCIQRIESLDAQMVVGGRYTPDAEDTTCDRVQDLESVSYPWLVVGFTPDGVEGGNGTSQRSRRECRDERVPFADASASRIYATANPVPDGRTRRRGLELIDAMMVESHVMLLLLRETIDPFHGAGAPLTTYAYAVLEKQPVELESTDYVGNTVADPRPTPASTLDVACSDDLIRTVTGRARTEPIQNLTKPELTVLARSIVRGDTSAVGDAPPPSIEASGEETVHYLCIYREEREPLSGSTEPTVVQREIFDAGPAGATACPPTATVFYFTLSTSVFGASFDPSQLACNTTDPESCLAKLREWVTAGRGIRLGTEARTAFSDAPSTVTFDLLFQCPGDSLADCTEDPLDRRTGKQFIDGSLAQVFFHPIETDIREAFRYRTQFASRSGNTVGFVPAICEGASSLVPYCYDPGAIEEAQERVDCALAIYHHHLANDVFDPAVADDAATLDTLRLFLRKSFSLEQRYDSLGNPIVDYGFERLSAELQIMLGDDAYTKAFASRFDLAGVNQLVFEGDRFEPNGVVLSGAAGYEMYQLYKATQHYQMVLDRFYGMSPRMWASLGESAADQYVTEATVTTYLDRVTRASTQMANAYSQIAQRYQAINRPDLARAVLERAYTRSHQESAILSELMTEITRVVSPSGIDQVRSAIEESQRRYRVALLGMREVYDRINDDITYFGMSPDYIPFPALDESDANGFEVLLTRAQQEMEVASTLEDRALTSSRAFDVDEALFQSELVSIRNNYQTQLGELCGTFVGVDGRVYPAIPRFAHLSTTFQGLDDPCGTDNGSIADQLGAIQDAALEVRRVRQQLVQLDAQADDQREWVAVQCQMIAQDVSRFLADQRSIDDLQGSIDQTDTAIGALDKVLDFVTETTSRINDATNATSPWAAIAQTGTNATWAAASIIHFAVTTTLEDQIDQKQAQIRDRERTYEAWTIGRQCDYLNAELTYTLRDLQRSMDMGQLDAYQATADLDGEVARLRALTTERMRVEAEWEDTEQLAINVAAAKADPNVRIYKNDAIINADRAFQRAIAAAYRATRVYEYYTAQSYPALDQLFLIRMVNAGDQNLRSYLANLEEAFFEFEFQYGNPDTRVAVVSVRDDVLEVPRYSLDGLERVLGDAERVRLFREMLASPSLRDEQGRITIPFSTTLDEVSPLTINHKILFVEVEMFGDTGDDVGRVYLTQDGTGVIRAAGNDRLYHTFPSRTAVVDLAFNGERPFDDSLPGPNSNVYRSFRFRERPFVQTSWRLSIDQVGESVNRDINLAAIDDILVRIYYTDFTP